MARPLQVLSLLSRLGARSVTPSGAAAGWRFASRSANKAWMGQSPRPGDRESNRAHRSRDEMSDGDLTLEDAEDKLQALVDEGRKRQRTVKYHILRRQMTPPGPPQRKLTWDAIEQIRYLMQEQPDEWTVERLADGFSVTPDVIRRVLRSKFVPVPERKAKQNAKVLTELSQQVLPAGAEQDRLRLSRSRTPAALLPGGREGAGDQALMLRGESSGALDKSPPPVTGLTTQIRVGISKDAPDTKSTEEDSAAKRDHTEEDGDDEESWDGLVLTEHELEEFMEMEKPPPVAQIGNEFFDAKGTFLYRI
ncbi:hypothetical protein L3Q82_015812 [Scortum barcoo]|uniref:Uncharacterized protein n=1 Tax=Scortum barcoo TaxID=214431 RepID=A0ACB8VPI4_9TELE|nr:hypothetical protein L3Q82_015812 [Scortum barcoo]